MSTVSITRVPSLSALLGIAVAVALCTPPVHAASPVDIRVYTDHEHPVTADAATRVVELDAPARLEAALNASLPSDASQAAAIVQERLMQRSPDWQREMAAAYQGVTDAWSLGITHLPAVVVDARYVVYGDPDVTHAVARIEAYRSTHP
ncbi:TIGR03757 family integrating conjugative element protein [Paraburkholderia ginsengisoli]|uniref:TIGR03757 family integrating conjugative element protein n=1 Tax=Paraburkholderia ginsengisoli TaxID=311231 RepID=A0A7T4T9F7_9BURK|nr:TIGR03757 family integrating conjugative element protein [Paraburkholderia ginsengisoli]QQC64340.1 TIGR03757 family integrating conjugative element protein [Paraburkholderia ginsengisoli]